MMTSLTKGITIRRIARGSPAGAAGLRAGDRVVAVNGETVADEIDFSYFTARHEAAVAVVRRGEPRRVTIRRRAGEFLGVTFAPRRLARCRNKCIFCFIDQMPRGLRKSLYVKDEDYLHSFLNGNYVTMSGLRTADLRRIAGRGVSPLYVSVHATDTRVRRMMLGNPSAPDVMAQLRLLCDNGVGLHTQIVVCPGVNDGRILDKTLSDLLTLRGLRSVAVVPVGITRFSRGVTRSVNCREAGELCRRVGARSDRCRRSGGGRQIFLADELFLAAGLPIPPRRYYEDYPQIENGVGLVRQLLDEWRSVKRQLRSAAGARPRDAGRRLLLTSQSAGPFLERIAAELMSMAPGPQIQVARVDNRFFGETVTVAGLLTAQDIIRTVRRTGGQWDGVFVPAAMFNTHGHTLDGFSRERIERSLGVAVSAPRSLRRLAGELTGAWQQEARS